MYIPLFNKSNYSLLSSLLKIDDIVSYAKENNISEIAIADTNMYGTMDGQKNVFLGVAFFSKKYKKLVADKVFYRG